jgi:hypothetical protein
MKPGDIISYLDMCKAEGASLQRGMNFRLHGQESIILMSIRVGAPYADRIEDNGKILIYEGHDSARNTNNPNPKQIDQPFYTPAGSLTQNGLFYQAAQSYQRGETAPEIVRVYEKLRDGIWVYNGQFQLVDAWEEEVNARKVYKFRLELDEGCQQFPSIEGPLEHDRLIPTRIKLEVWKRDKGRCVICESKDNLHFDHVIPYSKGGSSIVAENIQLLCARHNLSKGDKLV